MDTFFFKFVKIQKNLEFELKKKVKNKICHLLKESIKFNKDAVL